MLKSVLFTSVVALMITAPAISQTRATVSQLTCDAAFQFIINRGEVLVATSPSTYERVVSNGGFCLRNESPRPVVTVTRDNPSCQIGVYCGQVEGDRK